MSALITIAQKKYNVPLEELDIVKTFYELSNRMENYLITEPEIAGTSVYKFQDIIKLFEAVYSRESPNTLKSNISYLKSICNKLKCRDIDMSIFYNPELVIKTISRGTKISTLKQHLHVIVKLFRALKEPPPREYEIEIGILIEKLKNTKTYQATANEEKILNYLSSNEETIRTKLDNIIKENEALGKSDPSAYMRKALFSVYIDFPALRREWGNVLYTDRGVPPESSNNYYNIITSELTLNVFKNRKIYGKAMTVHLRDYPEALGCINEWLKHHPNPVHGHPLFPNSKGNALGAGLNMCLTHIFKIPNGSGGLLSVSCNILRKYYVMKHVLSGTEGPEQVAEIHRVMCHTANTALNSYSKSFSKSVD